MKANELMIGDWVQTTFMGNKVPCKVVGISTDITIEYQNCARKYEALKDVEPIPLTVEILEKNGWKGWEDSKLEGVTIFVKNFVFGENLLGIEDSIEIRIDCDPYGDFHYMCNGESFCYVNHVHQLQHALRLCGIEKEIQL